MENIQQVFKNVGVAVLGRKSGLGLFFGNRKKFTRLIRLDYHKSNKKIKEKCGRGSSGGFRALEWAGQHGSTSLRCVYGVCILNLNFLAFVVRTDGLCFSQLCSMLVIAGSTALPTLI